MFKSKYIMLLYMNHEWLAEMGTTEGWRTVASPEARYRNMISPILALLRKIYPYAVNPNYATVLKPIMAELNTLAIEVGDNTHITSIDLKHILDNLETRAISKIIALNKAPRVQSGGKKKNKTNMSTKKKHV